MQDLAPVGLTEDGTCLLLVTAAGEKFLLPVDDQLQRLVGSSRRTAPVAPAAAPEPAAASAAASSSPPSSSAADPAPSSARTTGPGSGTPSPANRRTTQEHPMDSALRPRDIQARIRSGESAETVAAAAGTSVEAILPYASPVLAERAHQAQVAQRASVRRGSGPAGGARTLGDAVAQFLVSRGLHDEDVAWDSWRRPDGRWTLTAQVQADGRAVEAEFVHDVAGRYVVADNDDAKTLVGDGPAAAPPAPPEAGRRLSAVPAPGPAGAVDPDSLGDDAIALVRDRREEPAVLDHPTPRPSAATPPAEPTEPVEPPAWADEPTVEVGADPGDAHLPEQPAASEPGRDAEPVGSERADEPTGDDEQPALDLGVPAPEAAPEAASEAAGPEAEKPRRGRRGRASVPSWDEIMFGGGDRPGAGGPGGTDGSGADRS